MKANDFAVAFLALSVLVTGVVAPYFPPIEDSCPKLERVNAINGFVCRVTTKTGWSQYAETGNDVYIKFFDAYSSASTPYYPLLIPNVNQFRLGHEDEMIVEVHGIEMPKPLISIYKSIGDGWFLEYVKVYCPSVHIDVYFPWNKWIGSQEGLTGPADRETIMNGDHVRFCQPIFSIPGATVICTNGVRWGSRCTFTCLEQYHNLVGNNCFYCNESKEWIPKEKLSCKPIV